MCRARGPKTFGFTTPKQKNIFFLLARARALMMVMFFIFLFIKKKDVEEMAINVAEMPISAEEMPFSSHLC